MSLRRLILPAVLLSLVPAIAGAEILKAEPGAGGLALGKKVLVDDGTCPKGQIKEVTGGSNTQNIARSSRCIPYGARK